MKKFILVAVILLDSLLVKGQLYYLNESFEEQDSRSGWISFPADPQVKWTYKKGGYNSTPLSAFEGDTNAILQRNDFVSFVRTLVSPPIDLQGAVKPMLSFAHAQYPFVFGQDELRLLFRAGVSDPWDTIMVWNQPVEEWNEVFFNIDEIGSKYLVSDFYIGFCGKTNSGNGVCIDKVVIEEKGIIPKYIRNFSVENVKQALLPSGVTNIPVIKVYLEVFGNVDSLKLNSITFTSTSSDDSVFNTLGFRLYSTSTSEFRTTENGLSTLITPSISISSGNVTFQGINQWLRTGPNYIWLTADIKPDRFTHGKAVDFKLLPNSVSINSLLLPANENNPAGSPIISESVFYDDFENVKGWTLDPDFEIANPKGMVVGYTRDPGYAYSGQKCLGTDLTVNGAYLMNVDEANAYFAGTPELNMKYFIDCKLHMKTWNGFDALDNATIDVSTDNGITWNTIWLNSADGLHAESKWNDLIFGKAFDDLVRKKEHVKVRFAVNYSDNQFAMSGWNIDNFSITGNYLDTDLEISRLLTPYDDCFNSGNDTVRIVVKNNASTPSPLNIPVYFSLNGKTGLRITDTIPGPIAGDDSVTFTFTRTADFPSAGDYSQFVVSLDLPGDEDTANNAIYKPIFVQRSIIPRSFEKFESNGGFWRAVKSSSWECMHPDGSIPVIPESPTSWMESPYGGYANNDTSWLVSSCYDLSKTPDLIIEMKIWLEADQGRDGMNIQYTTDNQKTWHTINNTVYGMNWGWYTEQVTALGEKGWTRNTAGWKVVKDFLPAGLLTQKKVQFRANWRSDASVNARGAALDDFRIYPAPPDIGISSIDSWGNSCQFHTPDQVTATITNFGTISLRQNDTVILAYSFNQLIMNTDTVIMNADLLPGHSVKHTFSKPVGQINPGNYTLAAFTIHDDPLFYGTNNDTTRIAFEVLPGPVIGLPDTIQTRTPDTVWLKPFYNPDYDYLWQDYSVERIYDVKYGGLYTVTVIDARGNGCSAQDSTYVELLFNDIGVNALLYPTDHCGLSSNEFITVRIKNYGTDVMASGEKIMVSRVFNEAVSTDTLKLTSQLPTGSTKDFTFTTGPVDLDTKGIYNFKIYTSYVGDTIAANDTLNTSIEILGRPGVSLGPDITVEALEHTIDAGGGNESYTWDNETHEQTRIEAHAPGKGINHHPLPVHITGHIYRRTAPD